MSFSTQVTVSSSLVTLGFGYWSFIKIPAVNFYQKYNDCENEERVSEVYKRRQINESDFEEKQDLIADYESDRYIPLLSLKVLSRPVNLGERTRSLTHLVNIESKKYQVKY